jgi:Flp pilus assembly protein TadD
MPQTSTDPQSTSLPVEQETSHGISHQNPGVQQMQAAVDMFSAGRYEEAEVLARGLIAQSFTHSFGWKLLGTLQGRTGRLAESVESLRKAAELMPVDAEVHNSLGVALFDSRQLDAAMDSYLRAVAIRPEYSDAHNNLAILLCELGQFESALVSCHRAIELRPDSAGAHNTLGSVFNSIGKFDDALSSCGRALEIRRDYPEAYCNIGISLKGLGQSGAAIDSFRRAIEIDPAYADAYSYLGNSLRTVGQLDAALISSHQALSIKPDCHTATLNIGLTLLALGRYSEGWPCYEMRSIIREKTTVASPVSIPPWRGESLHGKSLLLWPEQGFGDYIQFIRYASLLKDRGVSRLTIRCPAPLRDLLATAAGVDDVITDADPVPPHDYWSFPLSLPLHFGTTLESIPAAPYLRSLPERRERWRNRLPLGGFKVGLVWKGSSAHSNDTHRSLPSLNALRPLWRIPGITFVSLQKGAGEEDVGASGLPIAHLGSDIRDFADTAAIIDQLDLVICVDTAIAHVTGALGKPCWVLLPAIGCDWRWLQGRSDSPWYPHVLRLFRQKEQGDWSSVIDEVAIALRNCVG